MVRTGGAGAAWLLAIRPRTLPAAAAPVLLATGIAASRGVMAPLPAAAALVGALLIQIATNLANDYFDHRKGSDTEARVGPVRVVQAGLIAPATVLRATLWVLAAATLVGAYLVWVGGLPILVIGILSLLCAVAYTGGPFPLAYHGLGELFVFLFFGIIAVGGSYWVQTGAFTPDLLLAGAGVGALSTAILVVNNLRDIETDRLASKRTLAVRWGVRASRIEYLLLLLAAGVVPPIGILAFGWSTWTLAGSAALLSLPRPLAVVWGYGDPRELNPVLGQTARALAWYAVLFATGFITGGA